VINWAAWGPTGISIVTAIFFAGVLWNKQLAHDEKLKDHEEHLTAHDKDIAQVNVDVAKLTSFQEGYAAAVAAQERN
jgi:hypothetical protein